MKERSRFQLEWKGKKGLYMKRPKGKIDLPSGRLEKGKWDGCRPRQVLIDPL